MKNGVYLNDETRIDGKIVIVTGANTGLGLETAKNLAQRGGKIYLACRNDQKGLKAVEIVQNSSGNQNVKFLKLNLASFKSVREFCKSFCESEDRLDILINNAGLLSSGGVSEDGFELSMATHHLGHFLLTNLLLKMLEKSDQGRIVVVTSRFHDGRGKIERNDQTFTHFPGTYQAYANSKLANLLFTREMARKMKNTKVTINACCPGQVLTDAYRNYSIIYRLLLRIYNIGRMQSVEKGASSLVMLAVDPDLKNVLGKYFASCVETKPSKEAEDDVTSTWLWNESVKLTDFYPANTLLS